MANYEAPLFQAAVSTAYKSAGVLYSNGTRRIMLYEVELGASGAPASTDAQILWDLSRFTATTTLAGTSVIPNLLDTADSSPLALFFNAISAELTYSAAGAGLSLKSWGINQRGSYRWRALDDNDNIIIPAAVGTGIGLRAQSSAFTSTAIGNISFVER